MGKTIVVRPNQSQLLRLGYKSQLISELLTSIEKPINEDMIANKQPMFCELQLFDNNGVTVNCYGDGQSMFVVDKLSQIAVFSITIVEDLDELTIPTRIMIKPFLKTSRRYPYLSDINSKLFESINLTKPLVEIQILNVKLKPNVIDNIINFKYFLPETKMRVFIKIHSIIIGLLVFNTGSLILFGHDALFTLMLSVSFVILALILSK